ncbi:Zinc ion binding protein [Heracleum sosnowskyi]|uniref:Zinc ion binding protein n=1 Tax=Heracleum sosnowskyi TaxID=360622 RepID=A0AAD8H511_9APIA|nr:Zinc ion binding protein [Heracleum sosnowskyi]
MAGEELSGVPEEEEEEELMAGNIVGLTDAPILLLLCFHKALRVELTELRRIAVQAAERGGCDDGFVVDIRQRFEFLKLFYKYHSAAEDEVIFMALDKLVKNVVNTYSLEHASIDDLFDSVFCCLDVSMNDGHEDSPSPFQELVFRIGTIQTTIFQHMLKEEEQIFPLLMQQFSLEKQAAYVWQFMCSIPVTLLEDFLPWIISVLSSREQVEFMHCIAKVVPKEKLLQEVVHSWIGGKKQKYDSGGLGVQFRKGIGNYGDIHKMYTSDANIAGNQQLPEVFALQTGGNNPVDGIYLWHNAITKDLQVILLELYQMRSLNTFSDLASLVVQLNFIADTLIFYSNALNKIFYPIWNELSKDFTLPEYAQFLDERKIEGLQNLLSYKAHCAIPLKNYVEKLCGELELFVSWIDEHLTLLQKQVFPFIGKNCSHSIQQWLLYTSLKMMPLGLAKCMITWFAAHLSEEQSKSILSMNLEESLANKPLAAILCEWVRTSYSGKISTEKFKRDLQKFFNSRCSFLYEQIKEEAEILKLQLDMQHYNRSNSWLLEDNSAIKSDMHTSSSAPESTRNYDTSYNSGMNLHVLLPQNSNISSQISYRSSASNNATTFSCLKSTPMDHILVIHKALMKDLDYLVIASSKLSDSVSFLVDFRYRLRCVRLMYQIHSASEDDIAFPALEAKVDFKNISQSYTIDHKLEVEHFIKVSDILDEISRFLATISNDGINTLDHREPKYKQLCVKLHDMCISMHKVLSDHIHHEEIELLPLFREHFSIQEQEKIIGCMLGRINAESLQEIIPWLMSSLETEDQQSMMSLWRKVTENTKFDEWLGEWWEGGKVLNMAKVAELSNSLPWLTADELEVVTKYLVKGRLAGTDGSHCKISIENSHNSTDLSGNLVLDNKEDTVKENQHKGKPLKHADITGEVDNNRDGEGTDFSALADEKGKLLPICEKFRNEKDLSIMSQEELDAAIMCVNREPALDLQKKSYIIQCLLTSRWIATQKKLQSETEPTEEEKVPGQYPSYRDPHKQTYGCKHYKRNCRIVSSCCDTLYTCKKCHNKVAGHVMDRKSTTRMMCMRCLIIQTIGPTCSTPSCNKLSMASYYCKICKLFDDERQVYHCPYCNLCRLGKGLGIDFFHCMVCNACMNLSLTVHLCREKCFEDVCPICHESIFTSSTSIKSLKCSHLMHSSCFQAYTCSHYTCPICIKSLGDMQMYFEMLDAYLADEKIPDEHAGQTQAILCNDCEKRGNASFHWFYHKCPQCGSYNTRLL